MTDPTFKGARGAAAGSAGSDQQGGNSSSSSVSREKLHLKPQVVRIEVLGDEKVGKTSLICSLVSRHYSEKVPSVLLNVQIPAEESDENVIISITDTSCECSICLCVHGWASVLIVLCVWDDDL